MNESAGGLCPTCRERMRQSDDAREMVRIHKDQYNDLMNRLKDHVYSTAAEVYPNWGHVGELAHINQVLGELLGDE